MKAKKTGFLGGLVGLMLVVSLFMACGQTQEASDSSEKVVLTWWGWTLPTVEDFVVLKKGFEEKYPNIILESSVNQYNDYVSKLKVEFASGQGPDILSMKDGALLNQFKPYLLDLDANAKTVVSALTDSIVADARARSGGSLLVAPLGISSQMFVYYNATMFEQAGITSIPKTREEFIAVQDALKKTFPDKLTFAVGLKDTWFATDLFLMLANMVEAGVSEKADAGTLAWNADPFVKAMEMLASLVAADVIPKTSIGIAAYEDAIGLFMDGKAVMHANGSWNAGNLSAQYGDRRSDRVTTGDVFGAFPMPNFFGGDPVVIGGMDIGISLNKSLAQDPKKLDAALKLMDYMLVSEGRTYQTGRPGSGLIPTLKGSQFNMDAYPDEASKAGVNAMVTAYNENFAATREVSNTEVKDYLAVVVQNVINGKNPKAELDALQAVAERTR